MKLKILFLFISFFGSTFIICDIPTHCLQHQVVGKWVFYQTEAVPKNLAELYQHKCGIIDHTKVEDIAKFNMDKSLFKESFEIELKKEEHTATITKSSNDSKGPTVGTWTMVYDEGFEISLGKKDTINYSNYFIFLKYAKNDDTLEKVTSKFYSFCSQTLIGWYHTQNNKWGCFYGHKLVEDYEKPTNGEATDKQIVLQNVIQPAFIQISQKIDEKNSLIDSFKNSRFMQSESSSKLEAKTLLDSTFSTKTRTFMILNSEFTNHSEVVERINNSNLSWKAENYAEFEGKTISQINLMSGRKSKNGHYTRYSMENHSKYKKNSYENNLKKNRKISSRFKNVNNNKRTLKSIDYKKNIGNPKSQGSCGSCYILATNTMIEARSRLKHLDIIKKYYNKPEEFSISSEHTIKCSFYNQGCKGGYSFLVSKFYKEFELMPEECFNKNTCSNKCKEEKSEKGKLNIKVTNYYFVGDFYGYTTEDKIYEDLRDYGPLVMSIEPHYLFNSYKSGIFDTGKKTWKQLNLQKPEWEKVDHSVVLVGYGEENGIEYWIVQNSWGTFWGENGFMRLRKGKNLMNCEAYSEGAQISITED